MKYFAMIGENRVGPMSIEELVKEGVTPDTYVWRKGLPDWIPARDDAEICRHFRNRLHDKMHPVSSAIAIPAGEPAIDASASDAPKRYWEIRREIAARELKDDLNNPPAICPMWIIILAFIGFFPLAIVAYINNKRAVAMWNGHEPQLAHDAARRAKFSAGMALCIGVIILANLLRYL